VLSIGLAGSEGLLPIIRCKLATKALCASNPRRAAGTEAANIERQKRRQAEFVNDGQQRLLEIATETRADAKIWAAGVPQKRVLAKEHVDFDAVAEQEHSATAGNSGQAQRDRSA
jgi:hypothetical protein